MAIRTQHVITQFENLMESIEEPLKITFEIKLLKILTLLGNGDKQSSEQLYTIIGDIRRRSDITSNIGNAILYECICCVSSIHPSPKLFTAATNAIAKMLKSNIHSSRYMGIDALGRLKVGMPVVDSVVPRVPVYKHLEPGDILVSMNGEV